MAQLPDYIPTIYIEKSCLNTVIIPAITDGIKICDISWSYFPVYHIHKKKQYNLTTIPRTNHNCNDMVIIS